MSDSWSSTVFRESLQLIAEGVTSLVGFEVAAVSVMRDDGRLEVVAVAGSDECRDQLLGHRTPASDIHAEIANSEHWGNLRFIPAERMGLETENLGWIPDLEASDDPDAWHPLDLLLAPFYDESGQLRGMMSMDVPTDRRRPRPAKRVELQKYAEQAGRAVITAHDRATLAEELRLADTAREVIRRASAETSLPGIFDEIAETLVEGFNAHGLWIRTFDDDGPSLGAGTLYASPGLAVDLPAELADLGARAAAVLWRRQEVMVLSPDVVPDLIGSARHGAVVQFLAGLGLASMLFTPLGAGTRCLGSLVLARGPGQGEWTTRERRAALDVSFDLGRSLLTSRTLEQERRLNEELRALDGYKSQLISTVSHELRNPLTAVAGYLELLDDETGLGAGPERAIAAMGRGVSRMSRLVEDLLALSRAADPAVVVDREPVDLCLVVKDVLALTAPVYAQKNLQIRFDRPSTPVPTLGSYDDLEQVVTNLVSNAAKYSPAGAEIELEVRLDSFAAVFRCTDHGLGITSEDQQSLFLEFYRTDNPAALREQGTGLGLAIVKRIVERHHGEIEVESKIGQGSTFTVRLPLAEA